MGHVELSRGRVERSQRVPLLRLTWRLIESIEGGWQKSIIDLFYMGFLSAARGSRFRRTKHCGDHWTVSKTGKPMNGNKAGRHGGGVYNDGLHLLIDGDRSNGNKAGGDGGAVYNTNGGKVVIVDTRIHGNMATNGGGIYNDDGEVIAADSEFVGNKVAVRGGAIYNKDISMDAVVITGGEIRNNMADMSPPKHSGGGIYDVSTTSWSIPEKSFVRSSGCSGSVAGLDTEGT